MRCLVVFQNHTCCDELTDLVSARASELPGSLLVKSFKCHKWYVYMENMEPRDSFEDLAASEAAEENVMDDILERTTSHSMYSSSQAASGLDMSRTHSSR